MTALLFETSKFLIGLYLGRGGVGSGFGAASSLVVFLVWVYLSAQIFLLGAEFTWVYAHQRGSRSERRAKKDSVTVPSRAGGTTPDEKIEAIFDPPKRKSYPLTEKYAALAARGIKRSASGAGRLLRRKPMVGLGLLVGIGVIATAVVRRRPPSPGAGPQVD